MGSSASAVMRMLLGLLPSSSLTETMLVVKSFQGASRLQRGQPRKLFEEPDCLYGSNLGMWFTTTLMRSSRAGRPSRPHVSGEGMGYPACAQTETDRLGTERGDTSVSSSGPVLQNGPDSSALPPSSGQILECVDAHTLTFSQTGPVQSPAGKRTISYEQGA